MTLPKKLFPAIFSITLVATVAACADDFGRDYESTSERIIFASPQFRDPDSVSARGVSEPELVDVIALDTEDGSDSLFLEVYAEDMPLAVQQPQVQSRGQQKSSWDSFGLFAYKYKASDGWNGEHTPDFAYNDRFTISGGTVTPPKEYYWPGSKYKLRFFAVMPYGEGTPNAADSKGYPTLDYTVTTDVAKQTDILVGASGELACNSYLPVEMKFSHPLAAIKFVTDNTAKDNYLSGGKACGSFYTGTIFDLSINNVYGRATYNLDKGEWSAHNEKTSYKITLNQSNVSGSSTQSITNQNNTFFIIPQTAPDDAEVSIKYRDSETQTDRVLKTRLANMKWEAGKAYTYKLSTSSIKIDYVIDIDDSDCRPLQYEGGEINLNVKSYKVVSRDGDPVKYVKMDLSTPTIKQRHGTATTWSGVKKDATISLTTAASTALDDYSYKVNIPVMQYNANVDDFTYTMKKRSIGANSTTSPYNLSNDGIGYSGKIMNTANCYVVDFQGYACFPVVFGPTFKDGVQRDYSYHDNLGECNHDFSYFNDPDKAGKQPVCAINQDKILHPAPALPKKIIDEKTNAVRTVMVPYDREKTYIKDYLSGDDTPYDWSNFTAKIDWVDVLSTAAKSVGEVELVEDGRYIRFYSNGRYCNAIISLYDNEGTRVWSWHIWCTDQINQNTDVRVQNNGFDFKMAAVDVGWVPYKTTSYDATEYQVQFVQKEGGKTQSIIVTKQSTDILGMSGRYHTWKFGHITPFAFQTTNYYYDGNNTRIAETITNSLTRPTLIERLYDNITKSWTEYSVAWEQCYFNIWSWNNRSAKYTADPVVKSLYDPCPVGYCMPPGLIFNAFGFKDIPGWQSNTVEDNEWRNGDTKYANGLEFFANPNKNKNETVAFYNTTYMTSQGFVTLSWANNGRYEIEYAGDQPYLEYRSPANTKGSIRPVREQ